MAYADRPDLVIKHKYYMISWAEEDPNAKIRAFWMLISRPGYTSMTLSYWVSRDNKWN
jgi:hypothetical protein